MKSVKRNSNIELLRIISMLMIIMHHFYLYGGMNTCTQIPARLFGEFIYMGGKIGAFTFVVITGYYSCDQVFKVNGVLKTWFAAFSYSLIIGSMAVLIFKSYDGGIFDVIKCFFPVLSNQYWFITAYMGMCFLAPFINFVISKMSNSQLIYLAFIMVSMFSVIPTITVLFNPFANTLLIFLTYYVLGALLKKIRINVDCKMIFLLTGSIFLIFFVHMIGYFVGGKVEKYAHWISGNYSFMIMIVVIALFKIVSSMKPRYFKCVNKIATSVIGVYLIHDSDFIRDSLWNYVQRIMNYSDKNSAVIVMEILVITILIYAICTCVELIRLFIVDHLIFRRQMFNGLCEKINKKVERIFPISGGAPDTINSINNS